VDYVRAYVPKNETGTRKNGDVSATYFIGAKNCYDTLSTGVPVLWNSAYSDELVYPNPFTKATKIEFTMAQEERMTLSILDQRGTIVRSLLSGSIVAEGRYTIIWDGTDALGQALPSGMYWYALQGEKSGEKVGKIMLEK